MGVHEGTVQQPNGILLNGLLPTEEAYVTRVLDPERWSRAEERIAELISCIQPNQPSEERRNSVACYVQQLIMKCFSCQVFAFGSVPLQTYLPDGDIDLTAFTNNNKLKDTWASEVRDMLESEQEKSEDAEFHVKEVQYIQAEVKIVKCIVENIVVDISFDQLGGLCTLCFLKEVNRLIDQNHLFKRSLILIKAWCYYESRILGAHHGLISTYALETLVMYIFHVFNNSFAGPLEVLYRFLEFFSKFDWDKFCVSLWGPVPICSLPDMTADPPRKDGEELLLSKKFIDACGFVYAVFPGGQEKQEQPFITKYFNVVDPLRTSNNLGRSVSKGNFFRIRSAFGLGAQRLARLLDCPEENLIVEVDQFFVNTWDRHGKGHRPDAPGPDLYGLRPVDLNNLDVYDSLSNYSSGKKGKGNVSSHAFKVKAPRASCVPNTASSQHGNPSLRQSSRTSNLSAFSHSQNQKTLDHLANSASAQNHHSAQNSRPNLGNELHATYPFARTQSSEVPSGGRHNRASVTWKGQNAPLGLDAIRNRHLASKISEKHSERLLNADAPSLRKESYHWSAHIATDSNSALNSYYGESGLGIIDELPYIDKTMQMPVNLVSAIPMSSSIASVGYAHRNSAGMIPANVPTINSPWCSSMHYSQGLVSYPVPQYPPIVGMVSQREEKVVIVDDDFTSRGMNGGDGDYGMGIKGETNNRRGLDSDDGGIVKENRELILETHGDSCQHHSIRGTDVYSVVSSRTKLSSEGSQHGSPTKVYKSKRDKRGRKTEPSTDPSSVDGSHMHGQKYEGTSVDHHSSHAYDDNGVWVPLRTVGTEVPDSIIHLSEPSYVQAHHIPNNEPAKMNGSNPELPIAPMIVGSGSRQIGINGHRVLPFALYATGPPVPFVTMLSVYNFANEGGNSAAPTCYSDRREELNNCHVSQSDQNFHSAEDVDYSSSSVEGKAFMEPSKQHESDILNSNFASDWQNLQNQWFSQNLRNHGPLLYPSSVDLPPVYLQGHFPRDDSGKPLPGNASLFSQPMSYGSRLIPFLPVQPAYNRSPSVSKHCANEIPRYPVLTETYPTNPKISFRGRHSSYSKNYNGNYSYDRKDHHVDREWNWNINSKPQFAGRGQYRNVVEKSNDRATPNNSRFSRGSLKHDSKPQFAGQGQDSNLVEKLNDRTTPNNRTSARGSLKTDSCSFYSQEALFSPFKGGSDCLT